MYRAPYEVRKKRLPVEDSRERVKGRLHQSINLNIKSEWHLNVKCCTEAGVCASSCVISISNELLLFPMKGVMSNGYNTYLTNQHCLYFNDMGNMVEEWAALLPSSRNMTGTLVRSGMPC